MSATPLIGPHSTYPGQRRDYKSWSLWAEDGLVFMENQEHGEVKMLTRFEAVDKLRGFAAEAAVWDRKRQSVDQQERAYAIDYHGYLRRLLQILHETIRDAGDQGDPTVPEIRKHKLRLFLRSRQAHLNGDRAANTTAAMNAIDNPDKTPIVFSSDSNWLARGPKGVDERR